MTSGDVNLDDLNIVAIPVKPKAKPIKKKKNNKYEKRRRKAEKARNGADHHPQSEGRIDSSVELTESKVSIATTEKIPVASNNIVESSPTLSAVAKEESDTPEIAKTTGSIEQKEQNNKEATAVALPKTDTLKTKSTKPSRRNRPKQDFTEEEDEFDHAKYMAEFHARPMELDRRSGARGTIKVSKESSHIFGVANDWESLSLYNRFVQTLTSSRFNLSKPTAIQAKTIKAFQSNPKNNILVHSETGSGKTLAYLLPILQSIAFGDSNNDGEVKRQSRKELGTKCIILCPTRELASQTLQVLERLCQANFAGWVVPGGLLGGDSRQSEKSRLRKGLALLVATPGRLLDHLQKTQSLLLNLKGKLQWLVLDEADRLLDMGLGDQVRQIVQIIRANEASKSQSWWRSVLVSATVTESVQDLAKERMLCGDQEWVWVKADNDKNKNGNINKEKRKEEYSSDSQENSSSIQEVDGDSNEGYSKSTPRQLAQFHLTVTAKLRLSSLIAFLVQRVSKGERVVVFMGTCASVDYHYQLFESSQSLWSNNENDKQAVKGLFGDKAQVFKLHGSVAHSKRNQTLKHFDKAKCAILLTTDVSARGLNLQGVNWTVQYDPPCEIADYVHRVGRVARAGKAGHSLLFLLPSEQGYLDVLKTKGITDLTALSLSSTLNQAASICQDVTNAGLKTGGGVSIEKTNSSRKNSRNGEYFCLEIQRRFEDCIIQDDIQAKKEWKESKSKRKRGKGDVSSKKKEGLLLELARGAFLSFLRAYSTKKEAAVRSIFSARALHLGHVARSFALKEPPKSLVSRSRAAQAGQKQQYEMDDEEANKPKALAFNSPIEASETNVNFDDVIGEQATRIFKRPKIENDKKNAKSLLLANAFKMQNNLMDAM